MSKVLLINGSPNENGCTSLALDELIKVLEDNDIETEKIWLGKKAMPDCIACGHCQSAGRCMYKDLVNDVHDEIDEIDGIVVGSPVYYGGPNGRLTSFMDRLFYSVPDEKFNGMIGASVVSCRRGGATAAFERLNQYFLMENMHVAGSQYWNQVHGTSPDQVKLDDEGLQTMRTLGENIAWLIKSIKAGEEKGIEKPAHEAHVFTNFIR